MCDRFLFLGLRDVEIDAAIVVLAEFSVECGEQFAERFAVPGHELGKEERGNSGVPLGEIEARADAAAFFAADQDVLLEHKLANIFKTDGDFVEFAAEFGGEFVDEFGDAERFGDVAGQIARTGKVPDEKREDLVRVDERAVAIDGADAVAIAVGAEAGVVFSGEDGFAKRRRCAARWVPDLLHRIEDRACYGFHRRRSRCAGRVRREGPRRSRT